MIKDTLQPVERREQLQGSEVVGLYYYPIKSCARVSTTRVEITPTGIKHDRELMLIFPNGDFVSQRDKGCEKLAVVQPEILEDGKMKVSAPGMEDLEVYVTHNGDEVDARIHATKGIQVVSQGNEANAWFSQYLGQDVKLVAMAEGYQRQVSQRWAPRTTDVVGFADGYNELLLSEESLAAHNARSPYPVPMERFRPSIVVAGNGTAFGEDEMKTIQIGDVVFDVVKPCIRCAITLVDQNSGRRGRDLPEDIRKEPLATLSTYRMAELKTGDKGVLFGQNLINQGVGHIQIGDKVYVLQTQQPPKLQVKG